MERSVGCEPADDGVDTGIEVTAKRPPAEAHYRPSFGLDGEVPGSVLLVVGVKRGAVAFDVEAHAVLFDREVEPVMPDDDACPGGDAPFQEGLVETELQRAVETGRVEAKGVGSQVPERIVVGKARIGVSDDDEASGARV